MGLVCQGSEAGKPPEQSKPYAHSQGLLNFRVATCCFLACFSLPRSAHSILQQSQQLGLVDCQCSEFGALLDNIHQAAAAGGGGADGVQEMQPAAPLEEPQPESQPHCL